MAGWYHWLYGREFEWTPGVVDGQGGLVCCDSWGRRESDMTERLNWIELNWTPCSIRLGIGPCYSGQSLLFNIKIWACLGPHNWSMSPRELRKALSRREVGHCGTTIKTCEINHCSNWQAKSPVIKWVQGFPLTPVTIQLLEGKGQTWEIKTE